MKAYLPTTCNYLLRKFNKGGRCIAAVFIVLLTALSIFLPTAEAGAYNPARQALIIGNSNYASAPLANPANDAVDIDNSLKELGFATISATDCNRLTMAEAINNFTAGLKEGAVALFYYAGHGIQLGGTNYLIPTDAQITRSEDVLLQGISLNYLLEMLHDKRTSVNIVILDACRNNPFASPKSRSLGNSRGLAVIQAPTGTVIIYATSPGAVAEDGEGRNGIFTKALLENIATPNVDIELMLRNVRKNVRKATNGRQVPWTSSSLVDSFLFNQLAGVQTAAQPDLKPASQEVKPNFYNSMDILVSGTGQSSHQDSLTRKATSQKAALSDAKAKARKILTEAPYLIPPATAKAYIDRGEIVDFVYIDDGHKAVLKYKISLTD